MFASQKRFARLTSLAMERCFVLVEEEKGLSKTSPGNGFVQKCFSVHKILSTLLIFLLVASSWFVSSSQAANHKLNTAIIFVPGFKGSILQEKKTQDVVWLKRRYALFGIPSNQKNILDFFAPDFGLSPTQELQAGAILGTLSLFWGLYDYDIYGSWMNYLKKRFKNHANIYPLAYDWRQDNVKSVILLADLVTHLRGKGYDEIWLISHSMGGLISSYYLRYGSQQPEDAHETWEGAQKIDKVIFAGIPFKGAMKIFRNMHVGDKAVIKGVSIPADALNSFPSSYQLLPSAGVKAFSENNNEVMELSIHDPKNWKKYGWGFFRSTKKQSPEIAETRFEFLKGSLQRAQVFSQRLHAPPSFQGLKGLSEIKLLNITGKKPSHACIYLLCEKERGFPFDLFREANIEKF